MMELPYVSVILPVRNEEKFIEATLSTVAIQKYPAEKMEIIIADGMSNDNTRLQVKNFQKAHHVLRILVIDNPEKTVPFGLNRAINVAKGEVIVRMDAHSVYPEDYIQRLVTSLFEHDAHNCGGVVNTLPARRGLNCEAIAVALSHPLGVGNSYFRIGSSQVKEVDTVPFGCFRRDVFDKIGLFDEDLVRNQDDEFNGRMKKAGYKVLLIPDVVVEYYARDSYSKLFRMYYQYGLYKPLASYKLGGVPTVRQLIPLGFVLFLSLGLLLSLLLPLVFWMYLTGLAVYFLLLSAVSVKTSLMRKSFFALHLILAFFILHFSYGIGYLKGIIALLFGWKSVFNKSSLSR